MDKVPTASIENIVYNRIFQAQTKAAEEVAVDGAVVCSDGASEFFLSISQEKKKRKVLIMHENPSTLQKDYKT